MMHFCGFSSLYHDLPDDDFIYMQDIRAQFVEQLKCLEQRSDAQVALLSEIQDYYRRRADVELEYSRSLDKLAKQTVAKCKADKQKQETWTYFSLHNYWKQLVQDTKSESRSRAALSDVYANVGAVKISTHAEALQRIFRKCKDIGAEAHQEILRVLSELHTALKTYQLCHSASCQAEAKFKASELQKTKFEEACPKKVGSRKHRFLEREYSKKLAKYQEFRLKSLRARNEYLLCINAANAALHKYFAEDLNDLLDCLDVGTPQWLGDSLNALNDAGRCVLQVQQTAVVGAEQWLANLDPRADKQRFLEWNHSLFVLPRRFEFQPHRGDEVAQVSAQKSVQDDLVQRYYQISHRLTQLRTETEEIWKTLETTEKTLLGMIKMPEMKIEECFRQSTADVALSVTPSSGAASVEQNGRRPSFREPDVQVQKRKHDMCEIEDFYLAKFREYLLTANLIQRLQARHQTIGSALGNASLLLPGVIYQRENSLSTENSPDGTPIGQSLQQLNGESHGVHGAGPGLLPKPRKKRIGRSVGQQTPKLFGGSLEEYVEQTGEEIPLVIRSCVRMLSLYGLHHQGIFRVSGSQLEINAFRDAFERGEDLLADVNDASDVNSVSGVLKLYFRELREPLFPLYMFDQFIECGRCDREEFVERMRDLVMKVPRAIFVVMRYLFAFLNHLSEFSDENMMDPYNLAICFGPTLIPIPDSRDQVEYHNYVNNLVKNLIICQERIFPNDGGAVYEKYLLAEQQLEVDKTEEMLLSDDERDEPAPALASEEEITASLECLPEVLSSDSMSELEPYASLSMQVSSDSPLVKRSCLPQVDDVGDEPHGASAALAGPERPEIWKRMEPLDQLAVALRGAPAGGRESNGVSIARAAEQPVRYRQSYMNATGQLGPSERLLQRSANRGQRSSLNASFDSSSSSAGADTSRTAGSLRFPAATGEDLFGRAPAQQPPRVRVRAPLDYSSDTGGTGETVVLPRTNSQGGSPDSLKELNQELKAVLSSLETFSTQAKHFRANYVAAAQPNDATPFGGAAPQMFANRLFLHSHLSRSVPNSPSAATAAMSTPLNASGCSPLTMVVTGYSSEKEKDRSNFTPDLVLNLPRTKSTPPNSNSLSSSPEASILAVQQPPVPLSPSVLRRVDAAEWTTRTSLMTTSNGSVYDLCDGEEGKRERMLYQSQTSLTIADRFAVDDESGTMRKSPGGGRETSVESREFDAEQPMAAPNGDAQSRAETVVLASLQSDGGRPATKREQQKPPVPRKPMNVANGNEQLPATLGWSREPVEILKM